MAAKASWRQTTRKRRASRSRAGAGPPSTMPNLPRCPLSGLDSLAVDANPLREASRQAVKDLGLILAPVLRPAVPLAPTPPETASNTMPNPTNKPLTVEQARLDVAHAVALAVAGHYTETQVTRAVNALIAAVRAEAGESAWDCAGITLPADVVTKLKGTP